uniref:Anaphase promoting complex subunit 13 n=1 Tax=Ovis aries TaxID=9940 RepID=A0AC11D7N0_SHEEP
PLGAWFWLCWASAGKGFPRPSLGSVGEAHVRVSADPIGRGRCPHLTLITTSLTARREGRKGLTRRPWTSPASAFGPIRQDQSCKRMDSEVQRDGRILDLIDDAWREDKLPYEDVAIPLNELPEPEQDNGGTTESVKEQEMKWTDLALQYLHENVPPIGN